MNCPAWVQIMGYNNNTGEQINEYKCTDTWMPILAIENSNQQRATAAEVEALRNEVALQHKQLVGLTLKTHGVKLVNRPAPETADNPGVIHQPINGTGTQ